MPNSRPFQRLLVANRGEIAIRVMRASAELGIETVAIYSEEDRFALHRFKADQSYKVGQAGKPLAAYLDIEGILAVAREAGVDAIHPGYGFLSENPDFAEACARDGIVFVGPSPEAMRRLGNKVAAKQLADSAQVPTIPATGPLPKDDESIRKLAAGVGYPLMCKASWGGGGRGMRVIETEADLIPSVTAARREAGAAFGNDEVYLEKLIRRASHVEVQILGDRHGGLVHLYERDCSVQRRHQKVVERAPAPYLENDPANRQALCEAALRIGRAAQYSNAGTVEFLFDRDSDRFYFIEVNPRIQVEHTVTEQVTGVDLVKAQILVAGGARLGTPASGVPPQDQIRLSGHALQCRVTTENPQNGFLPDYGRLLAYRSPAGFGIRLDGGTAYSGAVIGTAYDSLLVKVTAWGAESDEAIRRMDRALREFRIRGLSTNLQFLENVIAHPLFKSGECTTRFIDETPDLFKFPERQDRATKLLSYLGDVIVNGQPEVRSRVRPASMPVAPLPKALPDTIPDGNKQRLQQLGAEGFARWLREQPQVLFTDTTMRDAHQSLIATRMRTHDMLRIAPYYSRLLPQLLSLECWGGATFDVALRFLHEDPWARLRELRSRMPNMLLQMLLRASNAVGYKNYPDNVVRHFVAQAAKEGIDVFRIFDSLNWVENMRVAIDAVRESGALAEAAICYTGDMLAKGRNKYDLKYYVSMARELEAAGAHILGIKDMAGVCRPEAIRLLVKTLREETALPIHFHTHDTSGISAASVLAAAEAGCDAVDGAIGSWSGLTSQPNLESIAAALRDGPRDTGLDTQALREISRYWEVVRQTYGAFESEIRSGTADVYRHAMPGGQYTNLREQARSLGVEHRWPEVAEAYAQVNEMFGDIVKVTPTSKVVGDMALYMISSGLTAEDVVDPDKEINFPESVVELFRGELGQPPGGFPAALQKKILKGAAPVTARPGAHLPPQDLDAARKETAALLGTATASETDVASWLMYPKVFTEYAQHRKNYGDLSHLPSQQFFYGLGEHEELSVDLQKGKTLVIRYVTTSAANDNGERKVFFELNGQQRVVSVTEKAHAGAAKQRRRAEPGQTSHIAAPMPGVVVSVAAKEGQKVELGDPLLAIEAMKMETLLTAPFAGTVKEVVTPKGTRIEAKDLLLVIEPAE